MKIAAQHEPIKDMGTENESQGAFNYCLHPPSRVAQRRREVFKATRFPSCCGSRFHRQHQFPTNSSLSFSSLFPSFSAPMPDRTPRLPSAAVHQQQSSKGLLGDPRRGFSLTSKKEARWPSLGSREAWREGPRGFCHCRPHRLFFFFASLLVERGKTLQIHIGQGSVGQQIKPEDRLFELSGRKKKRIAQGLSLSRSWIKLQTQTPSFTQQTVMANIAIWTLKMHYK